jgi:hypothetical protein
MIVAEDEEEGEEGYADKEGIAERGVHAGQDPEGGAGIEGVGKVEEARKDANGGGGKDPMRYQDLRYAIGREKGQDGQVKKEAAGSTSVPDLNCLRFHG